MELENNPSSPALSIPLSHTAQMEELSIPSSTGVDTSPLHTSPADLKDIFSTSGVDTPPLETPPTGATHILSSSDVDTPPLRTALASVKDILSSSGSDTPLLHPPPAHTTQFRPPADVHTSPPHTPLKETRHTPYLPVVHTLVSYPPLSSETSELIAEELLISSPPKALISSEGFFDSLDDESPLRWREAMISMEVVKVEGMRAISSTHHPPGKHAIDPPLANGVDTARDPSCVSLSKAHIQKEEVSSSANIHIQKKGMNASHTQEREPSSNENALITPWKHTVFGEVLHCQTSKHYCVCDRGLDQKHKGKGLRHSDESAARSSMSPYIKLLVKVPMGMKPSVSGCLGSMVLGRDEGGVGIEGTEGGEGNYTAVLDIAKKFSPGDSNASSAKHLRGSYPKPHTIITPRKILEMLQSEELALVKILLTEEWLQYMNFLKKGDLICIESPSWYASKDSIDPSQSVVALTGLDTITKVEVHRGEGTDPLSYESVAKLRADVLIQHRRRSSWIKAASSPSHHSSLQADSIKKSSKSKSEPRAAHTKKDIQHTHSRKLKTASSTFKADGATLQEALEDGRVPDSPLSLPNASQEGDDIDSSLLNGRYELMLAANRNIVCANDYPPQRRLLPSTPSSKMLRSGSLELGINSEEGGVLEGVGMGEGSKRGDSFGRFFSVREDDLERLVEGVIARDRANRKGGRREASGKHSLSSSAYDKEYKRAEGRRSSSRLQDVFTGEKDLIIDCISTTDGRHVGINPTRFSGHASSVYDESRSVRSTDVQISMPRSSKSKKRAKEVLSFTFLRC